MAAQAQAILRLRTAEPSGSGRAGAGDTQRGRLAAVRRQAAAHEGAGVSLAHAQQHAGARFPRHSCAAQSPRRRQNRCQGSRPACLATAVAAQTPVLHAGGLELCQQDFMAAVVSVAGAILCVKAFDILATTGIMDRKLTRKGIHIICGPGFVATWVLFSASSGAPFLASLVPALNGLRLLLIGTGLLKDDSAVKSISREGDPKELLRGPLYYVIVMCVGTLFFWRTSPVALAAIAAMCGGDGMADVVGRRFGGGARLPFNPKKSVVGSLAMFLSTIALSLGLMALLAPFAPAPFDAGRVILPLIGVAFSCTLVEALPISTYIDDNISVPLTAAIAAHLLLT